MADSKEHKTNKSGDQPSDKAKKNIVFKRPTLDEPPVPPPGVIVIEGDTNFAVDSEYAHLSDEINNSPKYDDAEWHYGGAFPSEVPDSYGFTHIGFYLTWAAENELLSDFIRTESGADISKTLSREASPIHIIEVWDGKLVDDMMNDEGNAFSREHYGIENPIYFEDYVQAITDAGMELYRVAPTWENYDIVKPVLDRRLAEWRSRNGNKVK